MRKILANATVISIGLLGIICNMEARGAPLTSCQELPGGGWTPSGPGAVTGVQSVTGQPDATILHVYVRGQDDRIYQNAFAHPTGFAGWSEVPGSGVTRSEPVAAVVSQPFDPAPGHPNSILKVFHRGRDSRIYENDFNWTSWTGWSEVFGNGITLSGPAVVADGGTLKLFIRGLDSRIYENDFDGTNWSGWFPVPGGGLTISAPAAISYLNSLYLFHRGTNNRIYFLSGAAWIEVPRGDGREG